MPVTPPVRPNILLIVSDDQRFDTIGALGNPHIHTPNLDRLAWEGCAFERHFCTTPICTPARAEILTGCNSFTNQVPWFGMPINPALTLLPQAFQQAGYQTIHVGKWHNDGHPRDKGYDAVHGVFPADNLHAFATHGHWMRFAEDGRQVEGHSSELFTDFAIGAIGRASTDRPWCCYLAYSAPHDPHIAPPPFDTLYDPATMPLFPNFMPEHPFDNGDMAIRDELLENWPRTQEAMRRYRARYYGLISHLDHQIGRLLGQLNMQGCLENTVILFTGDQGLAVGSHGLLGKESMYDHSIAAPLLLWGPGIPAGGRSTAMSHHVDLLPTLCALAGVPRPATATDGYDLLPILRGETPRVREAILCEFYSPEEPGQPLRHTQRAVRTERWKLTWYPGIRRFQLFDLVNDPCELVDLLMPWRARRRVALERYPSTWRKDLWATPDLRLTYTEAHIMEVARDLHARMLALMDREGDPLPADLRPPCPVAT